MSSLIAAAFRRIGPATMGTTAAASVSAVRLRHGQRTSEGGRRPSSSSSSSSPPPSPTSLPRWPTPVHESRGDYRSDAAALEPHIGGPLYALQDSLPRLPVPSVEETLRRLTPTALPLAETDEERTAFVKACESFPSQAAELQRRLVERREGEPSKDTSWLQEWWNTLGYLDVRDPIAVNVSYFFQLADDPTLPSSGDGGDPDADADADPWSPAIQRGAAALRAVAEYRRSVCSGSMPTETIGHADRTTPLCSAAFKYMFHGCRVPRRGRDAYRLYDPSLHRHAAVAVRGRFFAVDIVDENGIDPLPLDVVEGRLRRCVELAEEGARGGPELELGLLTSAGRDLWADAREVLLSSGGSDVGRALEKLESGMVLLCLDDEKPISWAQCAKLYWHGSISSSANRWFDKSIQLICTKNGKLGYLGEHSMADGMPAVGLCRHILQQTYRKSAETTGDSGTSSDWNDGAVVDIFSDCMGNLSASKDLSQLIVKAKENITSLVHENGLNFQSFQGYGSDYIKTVGHSPDAFVQMAIQLATYRLFGKQVGTYESTQVRKFLHGRTETTRSVSEASSAFVRKMGLMRYQGNGDEKLSLLRAATDGHTVYIRDAAQGMGVDRHLLGLSLLVEEGEESPTLFSDPLFLRAKRWRVSTSTLPNIPGFGPVVPDGVGIAYDIRPRSCYFTITAREEHNWTDRLSHLMEEALLEMKDLHENAHKPLVSKL